MSHRSAKHREGMRIHHSLALVKFELRREAPEWRPRTPCALPPFRTEKPGILRAMATPAKGETWGAKTIRHRGIDILLRAPGKSHTKPHFSRLPKQGTL